jgi:hypothetical protein
MSILTPGRIRSRPRFRAKRPVHVLPAHSL